ncbi:hypothetical protein [Candidatus Halocynthiibacter alkanivorans]|uniref:hypothetical protein n=1 Tax=Candidatus Halocynthiibacter alkanivorans TaxID=2267619 RepID=UPI000DF37DF7|nr:hypothetical protein [Candidatus Halocynthiibacter alkanivorans]
MTHLEDYLKHYVSLKAPGYAVLVTGAWGTGKTFQVRECIPEESRVYVSLYGVQSVDKIHAEVFAAAHPTKAKTRGFFEKFRGQDVGAVGFTVPLGFVPDIANALLRNELKPEKILIFDDLERSGLDLKEVLGAINSYVEHKDFRVVVVAHDDEKLLGKDFRTLKEKTFGQTVLVEPQIERAFGRFLSEIKVEKARDFVAAHKAQIEDVFRQSKVKSLRILKHAVEDLVRLYSALNVKHQKNAEAMIELVQTFTALGVEVRSGQLVEKDLRNRRGVRIGHMMRDRRKAKDQPETPPLVVADEKYPSIELETGMLNDGVLVATLIEGRYPIEEIQASINNSPHFLVPEEVPPWKVVIHFDDLDDETVEVAREKMEQQFEKREVTDSGEMLHIFCLRMMMAENGIIDRTADEVVRESKSYLNDLLDCGRLPPQGPDWRWFDEFDRSYDGFAYWVSEANAGRFKEIWDHLIGSREDALRQTFPEVQKDLLRIVREDPKALFEAVSPTSSGHNPYATIPLLHEIPVTEFVDAWLGGNHENWRNVNHALENRFSHGQLERDLKDEKDWALELLNELDARSERETGFGALRIKRLKPRVLIELAQSLENADSDVE